MNKTVATKYSIGWCRHRPIIKKIFLKKGENKDVVFNINHSDLMFYDNDLKLIAEPGEFDVMIGGNSRDVKTATFTLK